MSASKALYGKLSGVSAVTNLVSTRIYPFGRVPQPPTFPHVSYDVGDAEYISSMGGASGLASNEIEITCMALTQSAAKELALEIRAALHGQRGTWGGVAVRGCFVSGVGDDANPVATGRDPNWYESVITARIWYHT